MDFCRSRKVLTARRKQLTKLGKGNKPNATRALTEKEVDLLYSSKYFGSSTPVSLQRTIWWIITTNFGHRARNEARQLLFGDIKIKVSEGTEYLEWDTERATKTRDGSVPMGHKRAFNPTALFCHRKHPVSQERSHMSHSLSQWEFGHFFAVPLKKVWKNFVPVTFRWTERSQSSFSPVPVVLF